MNEEDTFSTSFVSGMVLCISLRHTHDSMWQALKRIISREVAYPLLYDKQQMKENSALNPRIYLLALGTFALGTDLFVIAGVLPTIAHEQAVSVDTAGLLITFFSLMYGFCAPVLAAFT